MAWDYLSVNQRKNMVYTLGASFHCSYFFPSPSKKLSYSTAHMVPYVFQFWTNALKLLRTHSSRPSLKPLGSTSVNQIDIPIFWCSNAIKLPFLLVKCHSIPTSCWAGSMPLRLHMFVEKKSQSITMFDHLSVSFFFL